MRIIRDGGDFMPLLIDWNLRRCNQKGCTNRPTTIIAMQRDDIPVFALCEEHYQAGNKPGVEVSLSLEFDDFDAFKPISEETS